MFKEDYQRELDKLEMSDGFKELAARRMRQAARREDSRERPGEPAGGRPEEENETKVYRIPVDGRRWKPFFAMTAAILVLGTGVWLWNVRQSGRQPARQSDPVSRTTPVPTFSAVSTPAPSVPAEGEKQEPATAAPVLPGEKQVPVIGTIRLIQDIGPLLQEYGEDGFSPFKVRADIISEREYLVFENGEAGLTVWIKNEKLPDEEESIRIRYGGKEQEFFWPYWSEGPAGELLEGLCPYTGDFKNNGEPVLVFGLPGLGNIHIVDLNSLTECTVDSGGLKLPEDMRAEWDTGPLEPVLRLFYEGCEYRYRMPSEALPDNQGKEPLKTAELSVGEDLTLRPGYDMDKESIKAGAGVFLSGTGIALGSLHACLVWDGEKFSYSNRTFIGDVQLRLEASPDENTADEVMDMAIFGGIGEDYVQLDEAEWITADDRERMEELHLTESDMPEGFTVYNEEEGYVTCSLAPEARFYLLDENNILTECSREIFMQKAEREGITYLKAGLVNEEVCFLAERYVP